MSHKSLYQPFRLVTLFQGLNPLQITEIAEYAERMIFRDGDVILRAGEEGDAAYLIVKGKVALTHCGHDHNRGTSGQDAMGDIVTMPAGTLLGEMGMLIDGHIHASNVTAIGAVRAFKVTRASMHRQMDADPDLAAHFVAKISARLQSVADELHAISNTLTPQGDRDGKQSDHMSGNVATPPLAIAS